MYKHDHLPVSLLMQMIQHARALYSATLIDHWLNPRHFGRLERPDGYARQHSQFGDTLEIFIKVTENRITEIKFWTVGRVATIASGSMVAQMAIDNNIERVRAITNMDVFRKLGDLPKQSQHCTNLAVQTLGAAIENFLTKSG